MVRKQKKLLGSDQGDGSAGFFFGLRESYFCGFVILKDILFCPTAVIDTVVFFVEEWI